MFSGVLRHGCWQQSNLLSDPDLDATLRANGQGTSGNQDQELQVIQQLSWSQVGRLLYESLDVTSSPTAQQRQTRKGSAKWLGHDPATYVEEQSPRNWCMFFLPTAKGVIARVNPCRGPPSWGQFPGKPFRACSNYTALRCSECLAYKINAPTAPR